MLHKAEDRISDDLTLALTRTVQRWFGDPRRAGLERVTESEIEIICQLASSYVGRLFRAGWICEGRRKRRMLAVTLAGLLGACVVLEAAHYALDFDGDGRLTVRDAHAAVDLIFWGTDRSVPIRLRTPDGRILARHVSYSGSSEIDIVLEP